MSARRSRWDAPVQMMLAVGNPYGGKPSKAERDQLTVDNLDALLVDLARKGDRLVAWWWATRTIGGESGAYCYLCDRFVAGYAGNGRATYAARVTIDAHRAEHLADIRKARERPAPD